MDLLTQAATLWQKTHVIKTDDISLIHKYGLDDKQDWYDLLQNQRLKDYLDANKNWQTYSQRQIELLQKENIQFCHYYSKNYPKAYRDMDLPPLFLTYLGDLNSLDLASISVVGTRDPSHDAMTWMETYLYHIVKKYPLAVVSGAAVGVDRHAHGIASSCKRPTVAILPSGIANIYPKYFEKEVEEILSNKGVILSEYECYQAMQKHHFHQRNRLIAALGNLLLVVEAKRKSGSLITAKYAMNMGKEILVLPSSPLDVDKLGTLDLLFDGAYPVRDDIDLFNYLSPYLSKSINGNDNKNTVSNP